ncbi:tail fiber assembly protein [Citrobacter sp. CtB7.12]|uniref:tail fiber assembly protein n=1 Tax=Citrobacter sp. CtB7.12 TaxID=1696093 RepID=UPI0006BA4EFE|nr:tail fiber assembly protein [Citrobacter sp. CtB7.12]
MELKNVRLYQPKERTYGDDAIYFQSEDGQDFYVSLPEFTLKYALCIEPDSGIIRSIAEDASRLYPGRCTVVETDTLPERCDINDGWQHRDGMVSAVPVNYAMQAEKERSRRLKEADDVIRDWRTELALGIISDENRASLILWMTCISTMKALDLSNVSDEPTYNAIAWSGCPDIS